MVDVSKASMSGYLSGKVNPHEKKKEQIALALGKPYNFFQMEEVNMEIAADGGYRLKVDLAAKLMGQIDVSGWTTLFIFNLFSFGLVMLTLGILGEYLWRIFDASRNRPPYIIEDQNITGDKNIIEDENKRNGKSYEAEKVRKERCGRHAGMDARS